MLQYCAKQMNQFMTFFVYVTLPDVTVVFLNKNHIYISQNVLHVWPLLNIMGLRCNTLDEDKSIMYSLYNKLN